MKVSSLQIDLVNYLPSELSLKIFSDLRLRDLASCMGVCREWHNLVADKALWPLAIRKEDWVTYVQNIKEEPPPIGNSFRILNSSCPFVKGSRVKETHLLVFIPAGMTLRKFIPLIEKCKKGFKTSIFCPELILQKWGEASSKEAYWMLLTKDVISGSRNKPKREQLKSLSKYPSYRIPKIAEVVYALALSHLKMGKKFYPQEPGTYTRCEEGDVVVGNFGSHSFAVVNNNWAADFFGVGAVRVLKNPQTS